MGSEIPKFKDDLGTEQQNDDDDHNNDIEASTEQSQMRRPAFAGRFRLVGLMQGLQRVSRLQEEVVNTQINFRQKRREAAFKREHVWDCDAKFMRELQQVIAQGRQYLPEDFERLEELATECQVARDDLGPIEQEGIEAEQRWEGQIWSLRQAETRLYNDFDAEFRMANSYPSAPQSEDSSQYESQSEPSTEQFDEEPPELPAHLASNIAREGSSHSWDQLFDLGAKTHALDPLINGQILLGVKASYESELLLAEDNVEAWESDSGIAEIDRAETSAPPKSMDSSQELLSRAVGHSLYSNLLTDFGSRRDRINKWLKNMVLTSRLEATSVFTTLEDQLAREDKAVPSNWSQLVIAFWELDTAATPYRRQREWCANQPQGINRLSGTSSSTSDSGASLLEGGFVGHARDRISAKRESILVPESETSPQSKSHIASDDSLVFLQQNRRPP
ncbi:hypothetical protein BGZ60DRAFT_430307 [Tricladium varicosporioides]|nr:hypothetical protein BGZ60DRAFT_430307 [Hymenoscyphus varicosporioides]